MPEERPEHLINTCLKPLDMTWLLLSLLVIVVLFGQPNGLFLYFPYYPIIVAALILVCCFFTIIKKLALGKLSLLRLNIWLPLSLFFSWSLFSLIYAPDWIFGLRILLSMMTKALIFVLIIGLFNDDHQLNLLLGPISIVGALFSLQAIAQFIGIGILGAHPVGTFADTAFNENIVKSVALDNYGILGTARSYFMIGSHIFPRAQSIFLEPGWFANFLEFTIFSTLAYIGRKKNISPFRISTILIPQLLALFFTLSTAGWISLGLGGFVYIFLVYHKKSFSFFFKSSLILLLLFILVNFFAPIILSSVYNIMWTEKFVTPWGRASMPERLSAFNMSIDLISERPIWGWGTNQMRIVTGGTGANNSLITAFVELGLIGEILYLWIIMSILKTILINVRLSKLLNQPRFIKMTASTTGLFVALFAHSMLVDTCWTFFYWIGIALVYANFRLLENADKLAFHHAD
jgi:hypothetical protein